MCIVLLASCENFLNGGDVKDEIVSIIDYNNAPSYPINVEALKGSGTIKTPATGEVEKKVTDTFTVRFEPSDDHKFLYWEAVVKDLAQGEDPSAYITFENPESLETKVTLKKASAQVIVIRPVCPARLTYTFEQDSGELYPRDSSIEFTFNQTLAEGKLETSAEKYISIQNLPENTAVSTYYNAPAINSNKLVFCYDISNGFIPVDNDSQRAVTIRIPKESIWYVNNLYNDPVFVYPDADIKETFLINSETSKKVNIKYSVRQKNDQPLGILKINGEEPGINEYSYSVGQTISLRYKLPDNYTFKNWSFLDKDGNSIPETQLKFSISYQDNADTFGYDSTSNVAEMTVKIYNTMEQTVTIAPQIYDPVKIIVAKGADDSASFEVDELLLTQANTEFDLGLNNSISLMYKYSEVYKFYGWKITRQYKKDGADTTDVIEVNAQSLNQINLGYHYKENALTKGLDSQNRKAQIIFTVLDYIDGTITITPDVRTIPYAVIKLDGQHGKFNPAKDDYSVREGSVNSLGFETDSDYGFICWKVFNAQTQTEIPNQSYITFEDASKENTTYTLVNAPEDNLKLAIQPCVAERPQVLSYWPMYDAGEGSRSDTTIEVVFDHDVSFESILYDDKEVAALEAQNVVLQESEVYPGRYYGYTKGNEKFLKNIQIEDKRSGTNIAACFGEPVFEDAATLFIPVTDSDSLTAGTVVLVTISKDFFYEKDDVPVTMSASEKWRYLSNGERDTNKPIVSDNVNPIAFSIQGCNAFNLSGTDEPVIADDGSGLDVLDNFALTSGSQVNFTLNNILVTDTLSYPTTMFTLACTRIYDGHYAKITSPATTDKITKTIEYNFALGNKANYSGTHSLTGLQDGVYAVTYNFKDHSNNVRVFPPKSPADAATNNTEETKAFYFVVDTTNPEINGSLSEVTDARGTNSFKVSVPPLADGVRDIKESYIEYRVAGDTGAYSPKNFTASISAIDVEVTGLTVAGKKYEVRAIWKDRVGHTTTSDSIIVYTKPNKPTNLTCTTVDHKTINVTWTAPEGDFDGYTLYYKRNDQTNYTSIPLEANETSYTLSTSYAMTKYNFYITAKNHEINLPSDETDVESAVTKPAVPQFNYISTKKENQKPIFDIVWASNFGMCQTLKLLVSDSDQFPEDSTDTYNIKNNTDSRISSLSTFKGADLAFDKIYYFKIVSSATVDGTTQTNENTSLRRYSYLTPITNLDYSIVLSTYSSVKLNWTNSNKENDTGIYLELQSPNGSGNPDIISTTPVEESNLSTYTVENLTGNTQYRFGIQRYITLDGITLKSDCVYYPEDKVRGMTTKPEPIKNLTVTRNGDTYNLSWTNPETGYDYLYIEALITKPIGDTGYSNSYSKPVFEKEYSSMLEHDYKTTASVTSAALTEKFNGCYGAFQFIATTRVGYSEDDINYNYTKTRVNSVLPVKDYIKNFTVRKYKEGTNTKAELSWNDELANDLLSLTYKVYIYYWKKGGDCPSTPQRTITDITAYETTISGLEANTEYYFKLELRNNDGTLYDGSDDSEANSKTVIAPA